MNRIRAWANRVRNRRLRRVLMQVDATCIEAMAAAGKVHTAKHGDSIKRMRQGQVMAYQRVQRMLRKEMGL